MTQKRIGFKIFALIILNDLIDTTAQLLMKKGLGTIELTNGIDFLHHLFNSHQETLIFFWAGFLLYISNFLLWINILARMDLSTALPLASAGYILIPLAAIFFLHEWVSPLHWLGFTLIIFGIFLTAQSSRNEHTP